MPLLKPCVVREKHKKPLFSPFLQVNNAKADLSKAKSETEAYAKAAKADAMKKVDQFDKKVEDGAAKAKSGISSWFGGK